MGGGGDQEAEVRARGRQPLASLLKKPSLCLEVITAASYLGETSDLRSSSPLLLFLFGMKTKVQSQCVLLT